MNAIDVELVYEKTCPNIEAARVALLRAFSAAGLMPRWREWEVSTPDAPAHVHGYGSPTILVNGQDVAGGKNTGDGYCCRVYSHGSGAANGVPQLGDIARALKAAKATAASDNATSPWPLNAAAVPTIGVALLPKLACPACWPAYAGALSALGIGFFDYTPYLLPLTVLFLLTALAALAYRAEQRRGYEPFALGVLAAGTLVLGKFFYDSDLAMHLGLAVLVGASLWNAWPKAHRAGTLCPACPPARQERLSDHRT